MTGGKRGGKRTGRRAKGLSAIEMVRREMAKAEAWWRKPRRARRRRAKPVGWLSTETRIRVLEERVAKVEERVLQLTLRADASLGVPVALARRRARA